MLLSAPSHATHSALPGSLAELETRLALELQWLNLPPKAWTLSSQTVPSAELDVAVIGGGLCGLVALAALARIGIQRIRAFDRAPQGLEGPWITYARMETLRTRKEAAGPALGIPSLTFRAWFEAQFGRAAYEAMELIPRGQWMEYMVWYRKVLGLPVENDTAVTGLAFNGDGTVGLTCSGPDGTRTVRARRVIVATGLDGLGAPAMPAVARSVPARFVAHSADVFDVSALAGKRVVVVGAGASAMDNAAAALEAGAARVDIFVRRREVPRVDKFTGVGSQGMTHGYVGLPDAAKWTIMVEGERAQIPPPRHSVRRVVRHRNAHLHLASPIEALRERNGAVEIVTPRGRHMSDFIIFSTGFSIDFAKRPEFAALADRVLLWRDVYDPPEGMEHEGIGASPYLGPNFEFLPREGVAEAVSSVYCFAYPAVPSHGKITSGIPSISDGAARLAQGIARSIFVEDRDAQVGRFVAFDTPELLGDEWQDTGLRQEAARA